jgi:hypothetical protein
MRLYARGCRGRGCGQAGGAAPHLPLVHLPHGQHKVDTHAAQLRVGAVEQRRQQRQDVLALHALLVCAQLQEMHGAGVGEGGWEGGERQWWRWREEAGAQRARQGSRSRTGAPGAVGTPGSGALLRDHAPRHTGTRPPPRRPASCARLEGQPAGARTPWRWSRSGTGQHADHTHTQGAFHGLHGGAGASAPRAPPGAEQTRHTWLVQRKAPPPHLDEPHDHVLRQLHHTALGVVESLGDEQGHHLGARAGQLAGWWWWWWEEEDRDRDRGREGQGAPTRCTCCDCARPRARAPRESLCPRTHTCAEPSRVRMVVATQARPASSASTADSLATRLTIASFTEAHAAANRTAMGMCVCACVCRSRGAHTHISSGNGGQQVSAGRPAPPTPYRART